MAITIEQNPPTYSPVYNEMIFVLSSTNSALTGFKYLADVYIEGSGTKEKRFKIPIEPITGSSYGVVDVHRVLESFLSSDLGDTTATTGIINADNSQINYQVKFGEEYNVAGVLTQFPDLTVDTLRYAWNAALRYEDEVDFDYTDYQLDGGTKKLLTNAPAIQKTSITDHGWLNMLFIATGEPDEIVVETYDSSDVLIQQVLIDNPVINDNFKKVVQVPSNPATLNLIDASHLNAGAQPIITTSVSYYKIYAYNSPVVTSQEYRFNIVEPCRYDKKRLIFLNSLGGYDGFNFNLKSVASESNTKKFYKKNPSRLSAAGAYTQSRSDNQNVQYYNKSTEKLKVTSEHLTDDESIWLKELAQSPRVYLEDGDTLIAVKAVMLDDYITRTANNDRLHELEFELEFSHNNYRQRG